MMNAASIDPAAAESLLAFWRDAGVDACFEDAAIDRTHVEPLPARKAVLKATAAVVAAPDAAACAAQARALANEATTMDDLIAAAATFDGCGLKHQGARRAVVGAGPANAKLLVIGNAPGPDEDASGEVFAGPAGRLLNAMLDAAGLTERTYRMNAVFWRPPGDRPPVVEEQAACLPFLERALTLLQPEAVLLLGSGPTRAVLNATDSLLSLRGQWRDWRPPEGGLSVPALITLSPGFLLRQPQAKRQAWSDMLSLAVRLDTAPIADPG